MGVAVLAAIRERFEHCKALLPSAEIADREPLVDEEATPERGIQHGVHRLEVPEGEEKKEEKKRKKKDVIDGTLSIGERRLSLEWEGAGDKTPA